MERLDKPIFVRTANLCFILFFAASFQFTVAGIERFDETEWYCTEGKFLVTFIIFYEVKANRSIIARPTLLKDLMEEVEVLVQFYFLRHKMLIELLRCLMGKDYILLISQI